MDINISPGLPFVRGAHSLLRIRMRSSDLCPCATLLTDNIRKEALVGDALLAESANSLNRETDSRELLLVLQNPVRCGVPCVVDGDMYLSLMPFGPLKPGQLFMSN